MGRLPNAEAAYNNYDLHQLRTKLCRLGTTPYAVSRVIYWQNNNFLVIFNIAAE